MLWAGWTFVCAGLALRVAGLERVALETAPQPAYRMTSAGDQIALNNLFDMRYYVNVEIGTPGQPLKLHVMADSLSSWVPCASTLSPGSTHQAYDMKRSATGRTVSTNPFTVDGMTGKYGQDILHLGALKVNNFSFGVIGHGYESYDRVAMADDGVLGLGFYRGGPPVLRSLVRAGSIEEPVFALYLGRDSGMGELALGGAAPERYEGRFWFANMARTRNTWGVPLNGVWFGNHNYFAGVDMVASLSTASSIAGPADQVQKFVDMWGAKAVSETVSDWFTVPCKASGPALTFQINGKDFTLGYDDLVMEMGGACYLLMKQVSGNAWHLALPFMRKFYVQFDAGRERVGFAWAKHAA